MVGNPSVTPDTPVRDASDIRNSVSLQLAWLAEEARALRHVNCGTLPSVRTPRKLCRVHAYVGFWSIATTLALVIRFTVFAGTSIDARWPMATVYVSGTWIPLMVANGVEQRRLALAAGLHGRGTFGVLRGWIKTAGIELVLDEDDEKVSDKLRRAVAEYSRFRRLQPWLLILYAVIVPLLLF